MAAVICITGGAGFIGSHLARHYSRKKNQVILVDNLSSGNRASIAPLLESGQAVLYEEDIRNLSALMRIFERHRCMLCINCAALVSVPASMERPRETEDINVGGLINVLECAALTGVRSFVHTSSAAVYGEGAAVPKVESMIPSPHSPYAITKLAGEFYTRLYAGLRGFSFINCRFFNVFGDGQDPNSPYAAVIPRFITRAFRNEPIEIFGDGSQLRDFIYVGDVVQAIDFLHTRFDGYAASAGDVFNIGYGIPRSIHDLAQAILRYTGSRSPLVHSDPREGDIVYSCANVDRLNSLGYRPGIGFDEGLRRTIAWHRESLAMK